MKINRTYLYYLYLLIVALTALYPLAFLNHPLKYDAIDQAYPWKYFIGECLREGILPLWNPYQLLGSPIHADPQSSAWYPVTWFFGYLSGYSIYTLSIDFVLHIFLAGMGFFYLGKQLGFRDETAFLMGSAYMLSGFFTGNAQHFMWIISGTWIPFVIGAFIALKNRPGLKSAALMALAAFMIVTGGYPAFVFLLIYLMSGMMILWIVQDLMNRRKREALRLAGFTALAATFAALTVTVVIIGVYHLHGEMTRGAGVTLRQALFGAFTPPSFISFLLPFASIRNMDFYGTDLSMSNGYFGLIPLAFFITGLIIRKPALINLFLAWGLFCLAASVGDALPLREFLYHYVPGMNYFRFPALFRVFFIFSFLIVAAFAFDEWLKNDARMEKKIRMILIALIVAVFAIVVASAAKGSVGFGHFIRNDLFIFSETSTIAQHILFQGIIQLFLTGMALFILYGKKLIRHRTRLLLLLIAVDLVMATRLNGPYTVYSHLFRSKEVKAHADHFPPGFPLPGAGPVALNTDSRGLVFQTLWRNLNIFHKQVGFEGYNPLHLNGFEDLADNHPKLFSTILQNPLVYLSGNLLRIDSLEIHENEGRFDPSGVYLENVDHQTLSAIISNDKPGGSAVIREFSPLKVVVDVNSTSTALLNLLQNNYPGWKITIDGKPGPVYTGNLSFMATPVAAGQHEVVFEFRPRDVVAGFLVSLISVILLIIIAVIPVHRKT